MMKALKKVSWILGVLVLWPGQASAQPGRSQVEEGNRLYSEGLFDEAHQKYLEALLENPESPLIRFNDGNALYRSEDFQRAVERYLEAAESGDPALQSSAWYNLGNALYRHQQLQESLEAFKQALRANPEDYDAKHNLERVLEQLQEQEEQQNQQGEGEDQQQEQDQENENQEGQGQQNPEDQQEPQEGEDQPEDEEDQEQPQRGEEPPDEQEGQDQGQPEPQPGEMTQEEAERLLEAIREDPGEVNRRRAPATGRRPRKDW